jgi:glycosyltransferase involved in cell wall biosynthesis
MSNINSEKLMVLIVAYNAETTIEDLLNKIPEKIWKNSEEIIVSDDNSQDDTFHVAENWNKTHKKKNLKVVRHKENKGYGGNQKWGYSYAIKKGYSHVAMVHGDVQYSPRDIERLLNYFDEDNVGLVFGSRIAGHPLKGGMPKYKFLGNKFLTFIENLVLRQKLSEYHSGFRIYSCDSLKKIPFNMNSDDFYFDTQIIIQMVLASQKIKEGPIDTVYGDEKCYVKVIPYGLNILNELVIYLLNKFNIKKYGRYELNKK